jgi:uncharacterized protein (DUF1015 family)
MAEILPFRAWRYNPEKFQNIEELASPLFDVVSQKQIEQLYAQPYNSIHLSVPINDISYQEMANLLEEWKQQEVLVQDRMPTIYVYYQYFTLSGSSKEYCRKGFICNIKAYDWAEKVVLRHENTIPSSVNDRIELLKATEMNVAPTHGLYTDETFELEKYLDEAIQNPMYESEDYQGVRDVLAVIQDAKIIELFMKKIAPKQIILADGHHRYTGSLEHRKQKKLENPHHTGKEAYNYHLMYLTNTEADDLRILPTHRLIEGLKNFDEQAFIDKIYQYFDTKPVSDPYCINEVILGKKWSFGLITKNICCKIRLKPEVFAQMTWQFPEVVKDLDLTVLHYFAIEKVLGILGKDQRQSPHINFSRNVTECLEKIGKGETQIAFITQDVHIEDVKKVCESGYTLPQKSTYFYPKAICGFTFASIKEIENESMADGYFKGL